MLAGNRRVLRTVLSPVQKSVFEPFRAATSPCDGVKSVSFRDR